MELDSQPCFFLYAEPIIVYDLKPPAPEAIMLKIPI